jgi:single-strand DNA-binding protein
MNNLNSVLIEGHLTAAPRLKYTPAGTPVSSFSIGVNRYWKKDDDYQQEASFFEIESWGKLAETVASQLKKGRGVRVVGRLKQDRWEKDGNSFQKIKVVAEHIEFKPITKQSVAPVEESAEELVPVEA